VTLLLRYLVLLSVYGGIWISVAAAEQWEEPPVDLPTGELLLVVGNVYSPEEESAISPQRQQRAKECFRQARKHCENGEVGAALQWTTRTVYLDPNHEAGRRVLGHRRVGGEWAGAYAARQLESGETWHSSFGWIRAEEVARYEAGERRLGKIWITAKEDVRRHRAIKKGWQIRTDHFHVITNHSRQEATRLATKLETLYQLWQQLFGGFYLDAPQLLKRFDGKATSGYRSKPFRVVYYGSRKEYNATLRRQQPRIDITLGIYFDGTRTSHFFAGPEQDPGTIYHEAVHQFFHESARSSRDVGALANAWVLEGVACYFESLLEHEPKKREQGSPGRFFTLGSAEAGRLPAARHRRLVDDYYVPLAELSALGMTDLQRRTDIARLYSQSAGLATFLMHGQGGKYRPALVKLLRLIYTGRDEPTSLQQLTGRGFVELDREYREFLQPLAMPAAQP